MNKKYSVALGGGAARGFAHIGVLQYMEENHMEIKEISGTSMGAIVGAMYAYKKSTQDIIEFAESINYFKLIDVDLKTGLLKGNKVVKKLHEVFGDTQIQDLDIDLKIVATDIHASERKIFTQGSIVDALRASFSLPGIFVPQKINGVDYVDGGITTNLPIDVLDGKNVIGVTALKKLQGELSHSRKIWGIDIPKSIFNLSYQVLHRTILIMMQQNEERSIEKAKGDVVILKPEFGELDYYSFNKVDDFIEIGYKEAQKILGK